MSQTFEKILKLVANKEVKISDHGYDELTEDDILVKNVIESITDGVVIEDYPDYPKGPCVLVLQRAPENQLIHVVWGIPKGKQSPAVLITVYKPNPRKWSKDFMRRKK